MVIYHGQMTKGQNQKLKVRGQNAVVEMKVNSL